MVSAQYVEEINGLLKILPEEQLRQIYMFATKLLNEQNRTPYDRISKEQVLTDIRASKDEYRKGLAQEAKKAAEDIRLEFGL